MSVDGKAVEVFAHVTVEGGVLSQQLAELVSLVVVGEVTEDQQLLAFCLIQQMRERGIVISKSERCLPAQRRVRSGESGLA